MQERSAADEKKTTGQYVVYTMQQWQAHAPGHAVTVSIDGDKRTATWFLSAKGGDCADDDASAKLQTVTKTIPVEPEIPATPRRKR